MSVSFRKTFMSDDESKKIASLVFVKLAETKQLDDVTIAEHPKLFTEWDAKWTGNAGTIVVDDGNIYRSIHDIANTAQNTKPSATPSMWTKIGDPTVEYPEWIQPIGAHDAYLKGDKVSHKDKQWKSTYDSNTWEPGVYGWEEVV